MLEGVESRYANRIGPGYFATVASSVRRVIPSMEAWAISKRSNGSLWIGGNNADCNGMRADDGQLMVSVVEQAMPQNLRIHLKVWAVQAVLDGNFPQAGDAEI